MKWKATMPRKEPAPGKVQVVLGVKTDLGFRSEIAGEFDRNAVLPHWTAMCRLESGAAPESPWTPVANGLPDPEVDVLIKGVVSGSKNQEEYEIAGLFHGEWACRGTGDAPKFLVTHYMPIPKD